MRPAPGSHSPRPAPDELLPCFEGRDIREAFAHPDTADRLLGQGSVRLDGADWKVQLVDHLAYCDHLRFSR